jgi:cytochrome bd-type quinol oxidase subunit 1
MSVIFPPPGNDLALFNKGTPKKPEKPLPNWLKVAHVLCAAAIAESFGFVGAQFGLIVWHHPHDPQAMTGMIVAFVLSTIALVAATVAGKISLNLLGFS